MHRKGHCKGKSKYFQPTLTTNEWFAECWAGAINAIMKNVWCESSSHCIPSQKLTHSTYQETEPQKGSSSSNPSVFWSKLLVSGSVLATHSCCKYITSPFSRRNLRTLRSSSIFDDYCRHTFPPKIAWEHSRSPTRKNRSHQKGPFATSRWPMAWKSFMYTCILMVKR